MILRPMSDGMETFMISIFFLSMISTFFPSGQGERWHPTCDRMTLRRYNHRRQNTGKKWSSKADQTKYPWPPAKTDRKIEAPYKKPQWGVLAGLIRATKKVEATLAGRIILTKSAHIFRGEVMEAGAVMETVANQVCSNKIL